MENACDHLSDQFAAWGVSKPHVVGNSLGGAIALELGSRGLVSSVTALSPAGFFGHVGRLHAIVSLFLLRITALLTPKPILRFLAGKDWGRRMIGWVLYSHPERHDAKESYGDALALKHATAFERTAMAGVSLRVRPPGARADDDRLGNQGPDPPLHAVEDRARSASRRRGTSTCRAAGTCRWPTTPSSSSASSRRRWRRRNRRRPPDGIQRGRPVLTMAWRSWTVS